MKKSAFAEFGLLSGAVLAVVIALMVACVSFYVYLVHVPERKVVIHDEANIFTPVEEEDLYQQAQRLSRERNINVVIVTVNQGLDDRHSKSYAEKRYFEAVGKDRFRDNSGFEIYIDNTPDSSGSRFFWIVTNGSVFYRVNNKVVDSMFYQNRDTLSRGGFKKAVDNILPRFYSYDYNLGSVAAINILTILIPLIGAIGITYLGTRPLKLDVRPRFTTYKGESRIIRLKDSVADREVLYDPNGFDDPDRFTGIPDGSGSRGFHSGGHHYGGHSGGHVGGGGGFHGGGGGGGFHGGGHTGGGGGRF